MKQGIDFKWNERSGIGSNEVLELNFPQSIQFDKRVRKGNACESKAKLVDEIIKDLELKEMGQQQK